jgi:hypothetical protein
LVKQQLVVFSNLQYHGELSMMHEAIGDHTCPSPNNTYGYGRIDVFEAESETIGLPYDVPWLTAGPLAVELQPGRVFSTALLFKATGMEPGTYQVGIAVESNDPLAAYTNLTVSQTVFTLCEPLSDVIAGFRPSDPLVGGVVTFTTCVKGSQPISYTWTFEGGSIATG